MNKEVIEYKNIFYIFDINTIGGVEQFLYYLAKIYQNLTVIYSQGDIKQIERLEKIIPTIKYRNQQIKCKRAFFSYDTDQVDWFEAEEYLQIIHYTPKSRGIKPHINPKITKYIGVSKVVCDEFEAMTGIKPELIYNPIKIDESDKTLLIVSATRLTGEKGRENIVSIGEKLNKNGRPYIWLVFTNSKEYMDNPNIVFVEPTLNIIPYLKKADIVAQVSPSEAYGYTPNEALLVGTPVLLMNLPIWDELGIKNGVHGWIIDNINTFDVNELYNEIPKFKYTAPKSDWGKYLSKEVTK